MSNASIIYTITDEAPALATRSLLPIVRAFAAPAGVEFDERDISLAGRILAAFSDCLPRQQQQRDALAELGRVAKTPAANIIKLPNISASVPQLNAAIQELQSQGYAVPDYPETPRTDDERAIRQRYGAVLGSAVNPVLREGNSDRRVAAAVKQYAKNNPHSMGDWSSTSRTHVAHMDRGDFYGSEQSIVAAADDTLRIELAAADGGVTVLKESIQVLAGTVADAAVMRVADLRRFYAREFDAAADDGLLLSLHLKATMMKVSDPIMFGHAVSVYYAEALGKHEARLSELGIELRNGIGDVYDNIDSLADAEREAIEQDLAAVYASRPTLAMVDSDRGITNLHVPSNVIVDASMPAAIRSSGRMWGPDGKLHDTKALIPDRCYAGIYQACIEDCKTHGAFDPSTMGSVANVGLMAQKAEEYGSHDKTFEIPQAGTVRVVNAADEILMSHDVEAGDIWRMCTTRDVAIRDWVRLAVVRARATGDKTIFWLDPERAHDAQLIAKVRQYLADHDTDGLDIDILSPAAAMHETLARVRSGDNSISVTGNVLRDYLTDLFPILELGTSAKMLSIVPLLAGGGLYETGAGGSAPKHVQQFLREGHLRWDSLGEFLALAVSLGELAARHDNHPAGIIATALDTANAAFLRKNKSPSRNAGELDSRGSHFYLALYWARALAAQTDDTELAGRFAALATALADNEAQIVQEMADVQGRPVDIGGYYRPDPSLAERAMRPSTTLNDILASF